MKSDRVYLAHIADSIGAIESYVDGGREAFLRERIIRDAVIRNFEIIGEAAGKLSPKLRETTPAPCKKIVAFRNRLIHAYWRGSRSRLGRDCEGFAVLKEAVDRSLSEGEGN